jgi:formylglycine-generating enzyme required for sulfatase activity
MFRTSRPLSLRIFTAQPDLDADAVEAPVAAADPLADPEISEILTRPVRRAKGGLKARIQAGSSGFEFEALLQGVSTLDAHHTAVNPRDGADLVWVPAGEFAMGSATGERREIPVHRVALDGFWMYRLPVTVGQYRRFYSDIGRPLRSPPPWGWHRDDPIVNVSWEYASAYAEWAGAQLPTEAQWEYAARGTDGRVYPWGDEWDPAKCSNSVEGRERGVTRAGCYVQGVSAHGVLDMSGNVWEWTSDWYEETYYSFSPERNPPGPPIGTYRVLRGGSWGNESAHDYRATTRVACEPVVRGDSIGFRCVVGPDTVPAPSR